MTLFFACPTAHLHARHGGRRFVVQRRWLPIGGLVQTTFWRKSLPARAQQNVDPPNHYQRAAYRQQNATQAGPALPPSRCHLLRWLAWFRGSPFYTCAALPLNPSAFGSFSTFGLDGFWRCQLPAGVWLHFVRYIHLPCADRPCRLRLRVVLELLPQPLPTPVPQHTTVLLQASIQHTMVRQRAFRDCYTVLLHLPRTMITRCARWWFVLLDERSHHTTGCKHFYIPAVRFANLLQTQLPDAAAVGRLLAPAAHHHHYALLLYRWRRQMLLPTYPAMLPE